MEPDLTTTYLGLRLKHPLVASASPLSESLDGIRRLEDAGAAAVVLHSLFEEQLTSESRRLDHYLSYFTEAHAEALDYFPDVGDYHVGPEAYLDKIAAAKRATDIPIIGSLNGVSTGGWVEYARTIQEAGADALELNIYYLPVDPILTGEDVERMYLDVVRDVRSAVSIPLAVKLGPYFSAPAHMAMQFERAGVDGLVLFNRFYQPDFDLDALEVVPNLVLSSAYELRLPLRWTAILYGRIDLDLAVTSGVHTYPDVVKSVMAGARATLLASELLRHGVGRLRMIEEELRTWMEERAYGSVEQMRGSMSQLHVAEPAAFERANYMKVLQSWRPDPTGRLAHG